MNELIRKLICKIVGHEDIRVITQVKQTIKGSGNVMITQTDSHSNRIYVNGHEVYKEPNNRCSRCYQVIK